MRGKIKIIEWGIIIFLFAFFCFIAIQTRYEREEIYNAAMVQMEDGNIEDAIEMFASVSMYQDAQNYVTYLQAILFQESGWQKEAARLFESLDDFKDSESRLASIPSN